MKKFITAAAAGLDLWLLASWLNTIFANHAPGGLCAAWNVFKLIF